MRGIWSMTLPVGNKGPTAYSGRSDPEPIGPFLNMKKSPLNRVSKNPRKAAKRFVPVKVLREVKDRSGGRCEFYPFGSDNRCPEDAMPQPHHLLKRSQGGKHEASNLMDCCFFHHVWIENNPKAAMALGYHIPYKGYTP